MSQAMSQSYIVDQLDASFWSQQPEAIRSRVALVDGILHISEEIRGDLDMLALVATLRRKGVLHYKFHSPMEFAENYAKFIVRCITNKNEIERLLIDIIGRAYKDKASDIHLTDNGEYIRIQFRILGMLCEDTALDIETGRQLIRATYEHVSTSTDNQQFSINTRCDGRITDRVYLPENVHSIRVHCEPEDCPQAEGGFGTFMTLRLLYDSTEAQGTLAERMELLGFVASQIEDMEFLTQRTGMIIISGATGHGKTTLLKHIIEAMTVAMPYRAYHTVEDPPEFPLKNVHQIRVATNVPNKLVEYIDAMAGAMRSDPDVLMFGEIRYKEAAEVAIQAAMSGHPVFTTIHSSNAFGIVTRLVRMLSSVSAMITLDSLCDSNVMAGLEYQRLIPKLCPHCKRLFGDLDKAEKQIAIPKSIMTSLERVMDFEEINKIYVRSTGDDNCEYCNKRGFKGQTVAAEVVALDQDMLSAMRVGKTFEAYNIWRSKGKISFLDHAITLVKQGVVDPVFATIRLAVPLDFNKFFETSGGK
jgi:type II secretory ATPase GspE/PulE/Tfp pilus assembly ATPase PilB-like protein